MAWTESAQPDAEARVTRDLAIITDAVRAALGDGLVALLLVGSYARGEGGVIRDAHGVRAFNDYDLVCVVEASSLRQAKQSLPAVAQRCEHACEVSVDLWPITRASLDHAPPTLFWLDVAMGGVAVLDGDRTVLERLGPRGPRTVPLDEAARLLANRAAGLALSRLGGRWAEPVVLQRHVHKSVLACGDALLLATRQYAPSLSVRSARVRALATAVDGLDALPDAYDDALCFRRDPAQWTPPAGASVPEWGARSVALVSSWHMRLESWRLSTTLDPVTYARFSAPLYAESADTVGPRAWAASARLAMRQWREGSRSSLAALRHPREKLARAAVALAYCDDASLDAQCDAHLGLPPRRALAALERLVQCAG